MHKIERLFRGASPVFDQCFIYTTMNPRSILLLSCICHAPPHSRRGWLPRAPIPPPYAGRWTYHPAAWSPPPRPAPGDGCPSRPWGAIHRVRVRRVYRSYSNHTAHVNSPRCPRTPPARTNSCVFETSTQTVASFISELEKSFTHARLTVGGYIAVLGGVVDIIGCSFLRFRPLGNPNWFEINIGRDILMVSMELATDVRRDTTLPLAN